MKATVPWCSLRRKGATNIFEKAVQDEEGNLTFRSDGMWWWWWWWTEEAPQQQLRTACGLYQVSLAGRGSSHSPDNGRYRLELQVPTPTPLTRSVHRLRITSSLLITRLTLISDPHPGYQVWCTTEGTGHIFDLLHEHRVSVCSPLSSSRPVGCWRFTAISRQICSVVKKEVIRALIRKH